MLVLLQLCNAPTPQLLALRNHDWKVMCGVGESTDSVYKANIYSENELIL